MPLFAAWAYSRNGWEGSEYAGREFDGIPFRFNHPDRLRDQVKTDLIYRAIDEEQAQAPDGILASYVAGTHELRLTDYDHTQWSFRQRSISEAEAAVLARKMNGDYELPDPEESSRFDRMEQSGDFSPIRLESDRDRERWTRLCMSKYNLDDDADYWKTHAYEHPETGFDPDILLDPDAADREPETRPRTALEIRDSVAESAAWKYGDDMYRGYDRQDD